MSKSRFGFCPSAHDAEDTIQSPALLVSITFNEDDTWFLLWLNNACRALSRVTFFVAVSTSTTSRVEELRALAGSAGCSAQVVFSEPFVKCEGTSSIDRCGPDLLQAHSRNVHAALDAALPFTHATLLASNCLFSRATTPVQLLRYLRDPAHLPRMSWALDPYWYYLPRVRDDPGLHAWRQRVSDDAGEQCDHGSGSRIGTCLDTAKCSVTACVLSRFLTFEGFTATRLGWSILLPVIDDYLSGEHHRTYVAEEVVPATAFTIIADLCHLHHHFSSLGQISFGDQSGKPDDLTDIEIARAQEDQTAQLYFKIRNRIPEDGSVQMITSFCSGGACPRSDADERGVPGACGWQNASCK